jgi:hypothetical protein
MILVILGIQQEKEWTSVGILHSVAGMETLIAFH